MDEDVKKVRVYTSDGTMQIGTSPEPKVHCPMGYVHEGALLVLADTHKRLFVTPENRIGNYDLPPGGLALGTHVLEYETPDDAVQRLAVELGLLGVLNFTGAVQRSEERYGIKDNEMCRTYFMITPWKPMIPGEFRDIKEIARYFPDRGLSPTVQLKQMMTDPTVLMNSRHLEHIVQ